MSSPIKRSSIRRHAHGQPSKCFVCGRWGSHHFSDRDLCDSPVCDDCVGPLMRAGEVMAAALKEPNGKEN